MSQVPQKKPTIPSLKGKFHPTIGSSGAPVTSNGLRTDAALTGVTGLTNNYDMIITPSHIIARAGGLGSAQNVQSVSGCYPLFTCQTGTNGYFYNDFCSERDLHSLVEYRRYTSEEE